VSPMALPAWQRAHGSPLFAAQLRTVPQDFQVTERLGWECSGDGEHDYLWIEKTNANTDWVARQLALYADVPAKDVGYAGLKDRHAVTRQWFSVPRWHAPAWSGLDIDGVCVIDLQRHLRKLRRGAHRANSFRIVLRGDAIADTDAVENRLAMIRNKGVPNYFGEQRFGRNGGNLQLANDWARGRRLPRHKRSLAISTIRSFLFNEGLAKRVEGGTWNQFIPGDRANLNGTGSLFEVLEIDDDLQRRCRDMDIHPAGILAGEGSAIGPESWQNALAKQRVEPGSRSLRLPVQDLSSEFSEAGLVLAFTLERGAFATAVLRELCGVADSAHHD
jgi:tRNA pseudouridine13 synthase